MIGHVLVSFCPNHKTFLYAEINQKHPNHIGKPFC